MLKQVPSNLIARTTVYWEVKVRDYPPSEGWILTYFFRGNDTNAMFEVTGKPSDNGDWFQLEIFPSTTANAPAGNYQWQAIVSDGTSRIGIAVGNLILLPSLADQVAPWDGRSQIKKTLDNIKAVLEGRASKEINEYIIGDRRLIYIPFTELIALQNKYEQLYAQELRDERVSKGGDYLRPIRTRMGRLT